MLLRWKQFLIIRFIIIYFNWTVFGGLNINFWEKKKRREKTWCNSFLPLLLLLSFYSTIKMAFEFLEAGQYKVILGKSFDAKPKKKAPKYFNVKSKEIKFTYS